MSKAYVKEVTDLKEIERCRRRIHLIVLHCSATKEGLKYSPEQLVADHLRRGFVHAGYHFYVTSEGRLYALRPLEEAGAHARGYNQYSIGICYEGGLDGKGQPADTRTVAQRQTLLWLVRHLQSLFRDSYVVGHRDLSPDLNGDGIVGEEEWLKACPCFDAKLYNLPISAYPFRWL